MKLAFAGIGSLILLAGCQHFQTERREVTQLFDKGVTALSQIIETEPVEKERLAATPPEPPSPESLIAPVQKQAAVALPLIVPIQKQAAVTIPLIAPIQKQAAVTIPLIAPVQEQAALTVPFIAPVQEQVVVAESVIESVQEQVVVAESVIEPVQEQVVVAESVIEPVQEQVVVAESVIEPVQEQVVESESVIEAVQEQVVESESVIEPVQEQVAEAESVAESDQKQSAMAEKSAADTVLTNGYIYTVDDKRSVVQALAIRQGEIVAVGSSADIEEWIGPDTQVEDLAGKMVLPGLHDLLINPLAAVDAGLCDLNDALLSAPQLIQAVQSCIRQNEVADGQWVTLTGLNPELLRMELAPYDVIRTVLDQASLSHPVYLMGSDHYTYAVNSKALEHARTDEMSSAVPISRSSLKGFWKKQGYARFFGVDDKGEPTGELKDIVAAEVIAWPQLSADILKKQPQRFLQLLLSQGVTSIRDHQGDALAYDVYQHLADTDQLKVRVALTAGLSPNEFIDKKGAVKRDALMAHLQGLRARFSNYENLNADSVKVTLDGSLGKDSQEAALLEPYQNPLIGKGYKIERYIELDSKLCQSVRKHIDKFKYAKVKTLFFKKNGFSEEYCLEQKGKLYFTPEQLNELVMTLDQAGFAALIGSTGDRAVRVALDAIANTRDKKQSELPHTLTGVQLVHPEDIDRFGQIGAYVTPTYAWAVPWWEHDVAIAPYLAQIENLADIDQLYSQDNYWYQSTYPFQSLKEAGTTLTAGSAAPIEVRSPRPFWHIEKGLSRGEWVPKHPDQQAGAMAKDDWRYVVLNSQEQLALEDLIEAYTINGARALRHDHKVGSLEVGKRADLIVIDQNLFELVQRNLQDQIHQTEVVMTLVDGEVLYRHPQQPLPQRALSQK